MKNFNRLYEMNINDLIKTVVTGGILPNEVEKPESTFIVQPDSNVGNTGKINGCSCKNIQIEKSECGGIIVKSADMNIKLSKEVVNAISEFLKGESNA